MITQIGEKIATVLDIDTGTSGFVTICLQKPLAKVSDSYHEFENLKVIPTYLTHIIM